MTIPDSSSPPAQPRTHHVHGPLTSLFVAVSSFLPTRASRSFASSPPCCIVARVIGSRSTEWRNARDNLAPEIAPAARQDGNICVSPGPVPDRACNQPIGLDRRKTDILYSQQTDQDTVYEQDLLRDAGSVKPWLAYVEFKQQHGTLYEQAFVRCFPSVVSATRS